MKQEKTVIFKASAEFVEFLKKQASERGVSKSALIKACVAKQLNFNQDIV